MSEVFITSAVRTAVGSFNGSLSGMPAHDLGTIVIKETLNRSGIEGGDVDEVIFGQVLTAATGQNPARQASINAGLNNGNIFPKVINMNWIRKNSINQEFKHSSIHELMEKILIGVTLVSLCNYCSCVVV